MITTHIKKGYNVAIIAHIRPDGDAFGSAFCIRELCKICGANGYILCDGAEMPAHYSFIKEYEVVNTAPKDIKYDLCIAVDCADPPRMGVYRSFVETLPTINIDHHKTNPKFGKVDYIVPEASSTCEIVFDLLKQADVKITKPMAEYLYIGLSTDTGNFCHSNTTSKVLRIAAELIDIGVNPTPITTHLYKSNTLNNTKLKARAISNLVLFEDGRIAFTGVTIKDLKECGCKLSETEGLIDIPNNL
ncbi:MAG: bifunctional oligoribonuclease/PAP phosphatase NrnA, partial [Firmicutes bacterium]|nr:bifunctional oligoribonuclease/PAP phosphatase NrnA [Bacillota bacterium]